MPRPHRRANFRLELRVTREFLDRVETWRLSQPFTPTRTAAVLYLINRGLEAVADQPENRPVGGAPPPEQ